MKLAVIDSKNNKNRFMYLGKYESIKDVYEFLESYKGFFNTDCRFI